MKKFALLLCTVLGLLSFTGCKPEFVLDVADLPKEITFNHNALQETIIAGSENFLFTHIRDSVNNEVVAVYNEKNYTTTTFDWLTVKCSKNSYSINISATPNKGDSRTLFIGVRTDKNSGEIKVTQTGVSK